MNAHHILFPRASYESHFATRSLRQHPSLIVPMNEEIHDILHREVPVIPLIDHYTAMTVRRDYTPHSHYNKSLDSLMRCIDTAIRGSKVKPIQKQLGQLTIHALELQKPWLHIGAER